MLNTTMYLHGGVVKTSTEAGLFALNESKNEQKISPRPMSFQYFLILIGRKDCKI